MLLKMRLVPTDHSNKNKKFRLILSSSGGMVLEASLVLPLFILVVFFFSYMIQMSLTSTKMHTAVDNAVKQVSADIYPVYLGVQAIEQKNSGSTTGASTPDPLNAGSESAGRQLPGLSITDFAESFSSKLPAPLSDWLIDAVYKGTEPIEQLKTQATEAVLDPIIKPILKPFLEETGLNPDRTHVSRVQVPDLKTGKTPYFGIEISYELPIRVPFTGARLYLQSKAYERLWIGDTGELEPGDGQGSEEGAVKPLILEKPNPAFAGRKATVKAKITPGGTATLTIYYKSGKSTAKYLGTATANENGIIQWTWLVGGNTTPGTWEFVIETAEGGVTESVFTVESPNKRND